MAKKKTREHPKSERATKEKQVSFLIPKVGTIIVIIDNHMVVIQVQIRKNTIEDMLLDGGFGINIITKQLRLRLRLGLPKPKPTLI